MWQKVSSTLQWLPLSCSLASCCTQRSTARSRCVLLKANVFSTGVASCPSGRFRFRLTISTSSQCLWNVIPAQQGRRTMLGIRRIINCSSLAGPMKHIGTHLYRLHLSKDISVHGKLSSLRAVDDRKGAVWCLALSCYTEGT